VLRRAGLLAFLLAIIFAGSAAGETTEPDRYGAALGLGKSYDPHGHIAFALVSGFALFDYDRVWPHRAPEPLRFKVEGSLGVADWPEARAMASAGILALYYLDGLAAGRWRPYAEAGVGLVYTDFRVKGQGLRLNFNPQAGIGAEVRTGAGPPWLLALRGHHVSNGGIDDENRGINSVLIQVGRFF